MDSEKIFWIIVLIFVLILTIVAVIDVVNNNSISNECRVLGYTSGYASGLYGEGICVTEEEDVYTRLAEIQ